MAWVKPTNGFLKLNVKGVFDKETMRAAVGCVLRDGSGSWVKGSAGMLGLAPTICAELWALFYGLKMAWERNVGQEKKIIVELDSAEVAHAVLHPDPNFPMAQLVEWIDNLLHEPWKVLELVLIEESANKAAKWLADYKLNGNGGIEDLDEAPAGMNSVLATDAGM